CERHQAALVVDEAHATGVLGPRGAGLCEALGLEGAVDVRMGTLGKALGVFGAYAVGSRAVVDLLINRARPLIFSTALPGAICRAASQAISLLERQRWRRERLWKNIRHFADGLSRLGLTADARSAIFPIRIGDPRRALEASGALREKGILAKAVRPPTVPA